ncbi:MAG TPA: rhomboid family intramembrane serine protease [Edaphocola sp.]|nr:rhomboid family intramembrane serine protease [Edaphocola sp.]
MNYSNSSRKTLLSDYENNPLLKLVFFCGVGYVLLHLAKIIIFMWGQVPVMESTQYFYERILVHFAIQPAEQMRAHPWTILTYMFTGLSFFKMAASLFWLFIFGSAVQQLVGKSEILPLFLFCNIIGGIAFITTLSYQPVAFPDYMFVGPDAAALGFAVGACVTAPRHRVSIAASLQIPLWLLTVIYLGLTTILAIDAQIYAYYALLLAGAAAGVIYLLATKVGFRPGAWGNKIYSSVMHRVSGNKKLGGKNMGAQTEELNRILDKINENGIQSLSREEKKILEQYQ